jgi:3-hydroxyisobutyrate dehydrogenase
MGTKFYHCGKAGNGVVAKLVNNLLLGVNMCAASEGIAFGEKMGISPKILTDVTSVSTGRSFVVTDYNPYPGVDDTAPSTNNYEGGLSTLLMLNDLNLAIDAAKKVGATSDFAQSAAQYFEDTTK